ncbi:hypothetical protein [Rhizobium sp. Root482]|uniref:hypothetical protein n=1 Tax=Rhizobium sp. Root482 TaxID=1736543 RepID=UPI001FCDAE60|nr:hypothetical protein [Rhizobium sp. Root482]
MKDMIPEGVEAFKSNINETLKLPFATPGVYLVKCTTHYDVGMVVVGDNPAYVQAIKARNCRRRRPSGVTGHCRNCKGQ